MIEVPAVWLWNLFLGGVFVLSFYYFTQVGDALSFATTILIMGVCVVLILFANGVVNFV